MSGTIGAVDRALDILIYLYHEGKEKGISEMSRDLGLNKSTIHRNLTTLNSKGFVYQNTDTGKYWLGMQLFAMGTAVSKNLPLEETIKPYTRSLHEEFGEVINVSILDSNAQDGFRSTIIYKEESESQVLRVMPAIGSSSECHCSSVGKCLLAFGKNIPFEKFLNKPLKRYTDNTIANWNDFFECLDTVKKQGYAVDEGEQERELTCIGAPILDRSGAAVAAISLSGPSRRMHDGDFEYKIRRVKETAQLLTGQLIIPVNEIFGKKNQ